MDNKVKNLLVIIVAVILVIGAFIFIFTSNNKVDNVTHSSDDVIPTIYFGVFNWMNENLDKNTSTIASDHRIGRMAEVYGFNTTKNQTIELWNATNLDEYIDELNGTGKNHNRITHIIIDYIMKDVAVHIYEGLDRYMTDDSYEKFKQQPFELIYRNETAGQWVELYSVNWTYIDGI